MTSAGMTSQSHATRIGRRAEVAHVGVERLAAGDREDDGAEDERPARAVRREERRAVGGAERRQDRRVTGDLRRAERADRHEPDEHHRAEQRADPTRPATLDREEPDEDDARQRQDQRLERRRRDLEPLHRAEDRDRGRDHAVAVEERCAHHDEDRRPSDGARSAPFAAGRG